MSVVRRHPPPVLLELYRDLAKAKRTGRLSVTVLDRAAERYQDRAIMGRVAREYSVGRFVEKDYPKAIRYYSKPMLFRSAGIKYYLAEIYLAEDNPDRDVERGLKLLRVAAGEGDARAAARLDALSQAPPG